MFQPRGPLKAASKTLAVTLALLILLTCPGASLMPLGCAAAEESAKNPGSPVEKLPFEYSLTEVATAGEVKEPVALAASTPLSAERVQEIFARLKPLVAPAEQKLILPEDSLVRPPIPGNVVSEVFPPAAGPATPKFPELKTTGAPLAVSRISHSGNVDTLDQLSITFSQPLKALSQIADVDPSMFVTLTPQPPGAWKWAGTQTLLFNPENKRFPKATKYVVSVPGTATSLSGNKIDQARTYTIVTPATELITLQPVFEQAGQSGLPFPPGEFPTLSTTPVFFAHFNQAVDAAKILSHTRVVAGKVTYSLRAISREQLLGRGSAVKAATPAAGDKTWIAFEAVKPFEKDAKVIVTFDAGLPSAEGPLLNQKATTHQFQIQGAFKLVEPPQSSAGENGSIVLTFSNNIEPKSDLKALLKITPAIDLMTRSVNGNRLYIGGNIKPLTKYEIEVDGNLTDVYAQKLGKDLLVPVQTGKLERAFSADVPFKAYRSGETPRFKMWAQGARSVRVELRKVDAADYLLFKNGQYEGKSDSIGKVVHIENFNIGASGRQLNLDLKKHLGGPYGHILVKAELLPELKDNPQVARAWIESTDISLDVFNSRVLEVLATDLQSAKPLPGVELQLLKMPMKAVTDSRGLAVLPRQNNGSDDLLIARKGADSAIVMPEYGSWTVNEAVATPRWYSVSDRNLYKPGETVSVKGWLREMSYTDGGGINLSFPEHKKLSYKVFDSQGSEISAGVTDIDAKGGFTYDVQLPEKLQLGTAQIQMKAGSQALQNTKVSQWSCDTTLTLMVEEFRKPEFEMTLKAVKSSALVAGDSVNLTASAQYLVGGPLSSSAVDWAVTPSPATFAPPGWSEYNFGQNFNIYDWIEKHGRPQPDFNMGHKSLRGITDSTGKDSVQLKFLKLPSAPLNFACQATVQDVNRQNWSDSTSLLVHPAAVYVGMKKDKPFYFLNDKVNLNVVVCDLDGKIHKNAKVVVTLKELDGESKESEQVRSLTTGDQPSMVQFELAKSTISFTCRAVVKDSAGRENCCVDGSSLQMPPKDSTQLAQVQSIELTADKTEYKPGDVAEITVKSPFAPARGVLIITRNRNISNTDLVISEPSTIIKVPITDDHYPAVRVEAFVAGSSTRYGSGSVILSVPAKARTLNLTASATSPTAAPGQDVTINVSLVDSEKRPVVNNQVALAVVDESVLALTSYKWQNPIDFFYQSDLPSISESHSRAYSVDSSADASPERAPLMIMRDYDKRAPQGKNLRLEGMPLSRQAKSDLSSLPPPSALPPPPMPGGLVGQPFDPRYGQSNEVGQLADYAAGGSAGDSANVGGATVPHIALRQNFSSLAIFKPVVVTDAEGKAAVTFKLPDNVTRYRVMAVAVGHTNLFGSSESVLTAQMPLMVKPSPPRFMQIEDRCELPVVLQNQTDQPLRAEVALRAENAQVLESGKLVTVPPNDRVEVRFQTVATGQGQAQFQCAVISGQKSDAAEFSFPVMVPASSESFAAYGVVDEGAALQKLDKPHDVFEKLGGLTVETSSTAVQSLTDAYIYLRDYPYSCSEQLSSRAIAMLSLEDALTAFGILKGSEKEQYHSKIQNDIAVLEKRQRGDGGFGLWTANEDKQWPYVSIQVAQALGLARAKNYKVNDNCLSRARDYLKNIEKHLPADYPESLKIAVVARALQVRHSQKDDDVAAAKKVLTRAFAIKVKSKSNAKIAASMNMPVDQLKEVITVEMASWLLVILNKDQAYSADAKLLRDFIQSQIKETASTASANERGYGGDWNYCVFASPRRTDAAVLEALMEDEPKSTLIAKFVKGLLAHRRNGLWEGTQENGYILQALDRYFNIYEKQVPDFSAQTWLGKTLLANHKFAGRSVDRKITQVPMSYLLTNDSQDILINKEGPGRLYYRLALDYVPKNLKLKALEQGFTVSRQYSAADGKEDVQQDNEGIWHFKAGSTIKVKVAFSAPGTRYHVAMADPIPAGAEILNAALRGTQGGGDRQPVPFGDSFAPNRWRWWGNWYEHDNLRDHQAEAFTSLLNAGSHEYTYTIRATTPGRYTVPPTKVEEMYMSETFGRDQSETVIIE